MAEVVEIDVITPSPVMIDIGGPMMNPPVQSIEITQPVALFANFLPITFGNWRVKADGTFELKNTTTGLWHKISISGAAGAEVIDIYAGES